MTNKHPLISGIVMASVLSCTSALQAEAPRFTNGDRVAFIGDSITHDGAYHAFIYDFYLTRFPTQRVTFLNCGISGDSAAGANARFQWDILSKRPTVATIMLGMNDVGRDAYGLGVPTTQQTNQRKWALDGYRTNMQHLIDKLVEKQIRVTLVTPSPYDQSAQLAERNLFGVNDALAACGEFSKETAKARGFGLIDLNSPLTALNTEFQKADPKRTLIGADRVHPGALGHFLMSYYFLKEQGMTPVVASVTVDAQARKVTESANCAATSLAVSGDGISYSYAAEALPYPTSSAYREAESLVPFSHDLNTERIAVTGLADGDYTLSVDDALLGTYSAADLSSGINIAAIDASPMQRQAQALHAKNMERHSNAQTLRMFAMLEAGMHQAKVDMADPAAVEKHFAATRMEIQGKPWESYINDQIKKYIEMKPREEEIRKTMESLDDSLYTMNRPTAHTVSIKRK